MKNNGGFTLIELILVTVIIGILAGMVVTTFGGRVRDAQVRAAKGDIQAYGTAIELFALDNNDTYPQSLAELTAEVNQKRAYIKEVNKDPWGNDYIYEAGTGPNAVRMGEFEVYSAGPNGVPGDEDDITSSTVLE